MIDFIEPTIFFAVELLINFNFGYVPTRQHNPRHLIFLNVLQGFHCSIPFLYIVDALSVPKLLDEKL